MSLLLGCFHQHSKCHLPMNWHLSSLYSESLKNKSLSKLSYPQTCDHTIRNICFPSWFFLIYSELSYYSLPSAFDTIWKTLKWAYAGVNAKWNLVWLFITFWGSYILFLLWLSSGNSRVSVQGYFAERKAFFCTEFFYIMEYPADFETLMLC